LINNYKILKLHSNPKQFLLDQQLQIPNPQQKQNERKLTLDVFEKKCHKYNVFDATSIKING